MGQAVVSAAQVVYERRVVLQQADARPFGGKVRAVDVVEQAVVAGSPETHQGRLWGEVSRGCATVDVRTRFFVVVFIDMITTCDAVVSGV